jgi:hypothetical protein
MGARLSVVGDRESGMRANAVGGAKRPEAR